MQMMNMNVILFTHSSRIFMLVGSRLTATYLHQYRYTCSDWFRTGSVQAGHNFKLVLDCHQCPGIFSAGLFDLW